MTHAGPLLHGEAGPASQEDQSARRRRKETPMVGHPHFQSEQRQPAGRSGLGQGRRG